MLIMILLMIPTVLPIYGSRFSRMDQVKLVEDSLYKKFEIIWST